MQKIKLESLSKNNLTSLIDDPLHIYLNILWNGGPSAVTGQNFLKISKILGTILSLICKYIRLIEDIKYIW